MTVATTAIASQPAAPSSTYHQWSAAFCANAAQISLGASIGWLLITATGLQTWDRSHLAIDPLADVELGWVIGALLLSAAFGTVFISWMADGIGRKHTLCTLSLVQLLSWGLYMIATNATEMYIAGILAGFDGGGSVVIVLLFLAEIAEDRIRGSVVASTSLLLQFGNFLAIVSLHWLSPRECTYGLVLLPAVFLFAFVYYPDTPYQLRKENQKELAIKSLHLYRGARLPVHQYSDYIKREVLRFQQTVVDVKLHKDNFTTRAALKAFAILAALLLAQQCCHHFLIRLYTDRLPQLPLIIAADQLVLLVAAVQMIGSLLVLQLVDRCGRKAVLLISATGTAVAFAGIAVAVHLGCDSALVLSSCVGPLVVLASVGVLPMPNVLLVDLMPQQIRSVGITVCLSASWLLAFALYMLSAAEFFSLHIFAYVASALCLLAVVVVAVLMPETRGLSNEEIGKQLERR